MVDHELSFPPGIDVLDVVLVIKDRHGMDTLLDSIVALQKCLIVAPGPIPRSEALPYQSPYASPAEASVWSYAKSKGKLIEVDISRLVIRESADGNERFYGVPGISGREILSGQAKTPAGMTNHLSETIRALSTQSKDLSGLPKPGKCPSDRRVRTPPRET